MAISSEGKQVKLTLKEKLSYSAGKIPGGVFASFTGAINAFYYTWMGLDAYYILIGQVLYMIWNVINDPIFGYLQDGTRTKVGRYLPWIKFSAVPFTLGFIFLFFPPQNWRFQTGGQSYQIPLLIWYIVGQAIYDTFFTIVYLAHVSLAPQMTFDKKERIELNSIGSVMLFIGMGFSMAIPSIFLTEPTAEKIRIFQIFVVIFGIVCLIPWIFIVKFVKEKQELIPKEKTPFWQSIKYVFKNKSGILYMVYDGMSVGILNALLSGMFFMFAWIFGANKYNNVTDFNALFYWIAPILTLLIGIPIQMKIANKRDVKTALSYSQWMIALGCFIGYLGIILSNNLSDGDIWVVPNKLWLVSIGLSILFLGFSGDFLFHQAMRADTIDYDELKTGERRESIYAGVACLFGKVMESVSLATIPLIMKFYGLVPAEPGNPASDTVYPRDGVGSATIGVATGLFLFTGIMALIGAIAWFWYPLNRDELEKMHVKLDKMHKKKKEEYQKNE